MDQTAFSRWPDRPFGLTSPRGRSGACQITLSTAGTEAPTAGSNTWLTVCGGPELLGGIAFVYDAAMLRSWASDHRRRMFRSNRLMKDVWRR